MSLTHDFLIIEASGTELQILGTAVIFLQAEVLSPVKKMMEVAVIKGCDYNKEMLVSLKNMKAWDIMHPTFPIEDVILYCIRMIQNKSDQKYCSYHSIQISKSKQGRQ